MPRAMSWEGLPKWSLKSFSANISLCIFLLQLLIIIITFYYHLLLSFIYYYYSFFFSSYIIIHEYSFSFIILFHYSFIKVRYDPSVDAGDYVVVVNARHVQFTGSKFDNKYYKWHSGYPGGLKVQQ